MPCPGLGNIVALHLPGFGKACDRLHHSDSLQGIVPPERRTIAFPTTPPRINLTPISQLNLIRKLYAIIEPLFSSSMFA